MKPARGAKTSRVRRKPPANAARSAFPIVGVGASAGGLAALSELLTHLPGDVRAAVVIVQHLDPTHGSLTAEILSRVSGMPVAEIADGTRILPHHVYVIPPNTDLRLAGGRLKLSPRATSGQHLPIDLFFRTLADGCQARAVGVVLSGIASDGTAGVEAIKAAGGFTFAQDPESAAHDGMPRSAITSGAVDVVDSPQGIAGHIARLAERFAAGRGPVAPSVGGSGAESALKQIVSVMRTATGVDLAHYKPSTVQRRIGRRLFLHKIDDLAIYAEYLRSHPDEVQALFSDVLIHVTSFFRDPEAYETLKRKILPRLLERWDEQATFRIWVAGCATGEEAYSIAMTFFEALDDLRIHPSLQIFASDVSEANIQHARAGRYPATIAKDVSKERLARFFERVEGGDYRIAKWIRDTCLFSKQDLAADPPFAKIDLIVCRNVLIYFKADLHKRVLPIFHYALNPGGILWLGRSETINGFTTHFSLVDRTNKFYAKKVVATRFPALFPVSRHAAAPLDARRVPSVDTRLQVVQAETDRVALEQYVPAGVVVNDAGEILQVRGRPAPYLELAAGQASLNVFKLAHPEIISDLRYLLKEARKQRAPVRKDGLSLEASGHRHTFGIRIIPLHLPPESTEHYVAIFFEHQPADAAMTPVPAGPDTPAGRRKRSEAARKSESDRRYQQELIEEYETTQEALVASNEELQSTNEELQSTNEELETAKEELQSANEEMTTINDELQARNAEMTQVTNDLTNLLTSVDLAIVMVGPDARVRRFTPRAADTLNLIPGDVGRPIGDLRPAVDAPDLGDVVADVMKSLAVKEMEIQDKQGAWYRLQARPYRTADNRIDGAVIALADITDLKRSGEVLKRAADDAKMVTEAMPVPILVIDREGRIQATNQSFCSLFGVTRADIEAKSVADIDDGQWNIPALRAALDAVIAEGTPMHGLEVALEFRRVGRKSLRLHATRGHLDRDTRVALLAIEDVTERTRLETERQALLASEIDARREAERANQVKDEFLATLSHELRTPLSTTLAWVQVLRLSADMPQWLPAITAIERSVKVQTQLIEDLLDVSRIRAGKLRLECRDLDPRETISAAVESIHVLAETAGVTVSTDMTARPCRLYADPGRLEQVLRNLLTNAVAFTPAGGSITVRATSLADPERISIEVRDTGRGIKAEFLPKVWDRFTQEETNGGRRVGGLGLGLSIVKHLVELHGGTVKADSPGEGQGAVFTVILPCTSPPDTLATGGAVTPATAIDPQPSLTSLAGLRVLVIDDVVDVRDATAAVLRLLGAEVSVAASVVEGLTVVVSARPDVVLCDIGLPGEDGFSFIRQLRAMGTDRGSDTPAAALSAYAGADHVRRSLEAGFDLHLSKPTTAAELAKAVGELASRRRG